MKTNYAKIEKAIDRLLSAQAEVRKVASLRIGMISGGPSIDEENAEAKEAWNELEVLVRTALENGCREKVMLEAVRENKFFSAMVAEHFDKIRFDREWESMRARGLV